MIDAAAVMAARHPRVTADTLARVRGLLPQWLSHEDQAAVHAVLALAASVVAARDTEPPSLIGGEDV